MSEENIKRNTFLENISVRDNTSELAILNKVIQNVNLLRDMSIEELKKLNLAIKNRQSKLEQKRDLLKNDIAIEKFKAKK